MSIHFLKSFRGCKIQYSQGKNEFIKHKDKKWQTNCTATCCAISVEVQYENIVIKNYLPLLTVPTQQTLGLSYIRRHYGHITMWSTSTPHPERKRKNNLVITVLTAPTTPVTPTVEVSVSARTTGMLDDHPLSTQLLPIQLVHGIVSITIVLEFNKPIPETEIVLFKCGEWRLM